MSHAVNQLEYSLPEALNTAVQTKFDEWQKENKIFRIWSKDASVWSNTDEAKWLGWLAVVEVQQAQAQLFTDFQAEVKARNFSHILLLGMGGSSLCPRSFFNHLRATGWFSRTPYFGFDRSCSNQSR